MKVFSSFSSREMICVNHFWSYAIDYYNICFELFILMSRYSLMYALHLVINFVVSIKFSYLSSPYEDKWQYDIFMWKFVHPQFLITRISIFEANKRSRYYPLECNWCYEATRCTPFLYFLYEFVNMIIWLSYYQIFILQFEMPLVLLWWCNQNVLL